MDEPQFKKTVELPSLQLTPSQDTIRRNGFAAPRINPKTEIHNDSVIGATLSPANRAFLQDLEWSIDGAEVSWSAGILRTSAGISTVINEGSVTVGEAAYIYFDGTSTLKVTTSLADAMIDSKMLVAVAVMTEAGITLQVNGGQGSTVSGSSVRGGVIESADQTTMFDLVESRLMVLESIADLLQPTVIIGQLAEGVWGLLVDRGRAEIRDAEGVTILDGKGIRSISQFPTNTVQHDGTQTNTSTSTWADLTNMTLSLDLDQTAVVMLCAVVPCYNPTSGSSAEIVFDIDGTIVGPSMIAPPGSGSSLNCASATFPIQLAAGAHTIKLKFRAITGGTATIISGYLKHLSYVVLGH